MYRFFVTREQLDESPVCLKGKDYNHAHNVLRLRVGEQVLLCDGALREYTCEIVSFNEKEKQVCCKIVDMCNVSRELPAQITLFQGYAKGDKMEWIIQKAVELGVYEIVPVMMRRSVVKLDEKKADSRIKRMNGVALSAAKQAKRGIIPNVTKVMSVQEACKYAEEMDYLILPYENANGMEYARLVFENAKNKQKIGIFIGPEGGFEKEEVEQITAIGGKMITLGHRILRTETAGMTVLSVLMFLLEQDEEKGETE